MEIPQAKEKLNFNKIGEKLSHFFYGKTFPIQIALIITLCYIADLTLVALAVVSILASIIFIFYKNLAPILPLLFMVVMSFTDYDVMNGITPYLVLLPAIISFIAHFIIHPFKFERPSALFYALIFVTLAYAFAGITRDDYEFTFGIAYLVSLGPVMIIIYLLFSNSIMPRENFCIKKYLCYTLITTGLAMTAQIAFVRYIEISEIWAELGWGNVNGCAAYLLLCIPACYYLIIKSRIIYPLLICLLALYAGIFISGSDAALGVSVLYSPFLLFYTYRRIYRTKRNAFVYSTLAIVLSFAIAVTILIYEFGFEGMLNYLQIDTSVSGRGEIHQKAIELFKENPLFGYGFKYAEEGSTPSPIRLYNFHSTLFHVMATMGIFGIIAYALYFLVRFVILMRGCTPFTVTMLVAFIMFESYAMVDTGEFNAIPLMCSVTVIITVVEWVTKKENPPTVLPLTTNKRNGYYF